MLDWSSSSGAWALGEFGDDLNRYVDAGVLPQLRGDLTDHRGSSGKVRFAKALATSATATWPTPVTAGRFVPSHQSTGARPITMSVWNRNMRLILWTGCSADPWPTGWSASSTAVYVTFTPPNPLRRRDDAWGHQAGLLEHPRCKLRPKRRPRRFLDQASAPPEVGVKA